MGELAESFKDFIKSTDTSIKTLDTYTQKSFKAMAPPISATEAVQYLMPSLSEIEKRQFAWCVAAVNEEFQATGVWPVPEALDLPGLLDLNQAKAIFNDPNFVKACWLRGVRPLGTTLDERQLLTISVLTNLADKRSLNAKLKSLGVSELEYQTWQSHKPFKTKLIEASERALDASQAIVNMALTKSAIEGNLPSIIYLNKMTGRFDPDKDRQIADVQALLRSIIDIVTTEVTDPQTLERIGQKLIIATQVNGVIT